MADDDIDIDKLRREAAEILGDSFQFGTPLPGELTFTYDFYLKFIRAGFNERQALWMIVDSLFGQHFYHEVSIESLKNET